VGLDCCGVKKATGQGITRKKTEERGLSGSEKVPIELGRRAWMERDLGLGGGVVEGGGEGM